MIISSCGSRTWFTFFLWSLSGLISNRGPSSCLATTKDKDSIFVSDDNIFQRSYRLEDFFWTGSGDGPPLEDSFANETETGSPSPIDHDGWRTTTVFHTTTILFATVYPNGCTETGCVPMTSPVWTGSVEFSSPVTHPSVIHIEPTPSHRGPENGATVTRTLTVTERVTPTPTFRHDRVHPTTIVAPPGNFTGDAGSGEAFPRFDVDSSTPDTLDIPHDQRYWLLTVLKRDRFSPEIKVHVIEEKLSMLYRRAFIRQQEKHLGINGNSVTTTRPRRDRRIPEPVRVHIHNVTDLVSNDPDGIGLLYSVTVAGKPVPALTAASDMRLITVNEVVAELGYSVLTKAEPYLKGAVPLGARVKGRTRDTWLLIGAVIAAVVLLIVLAIIFTFGLSHRRDGTSEGRVTSNKKHIFEAEEGSSNLAFQDDSDSKVKIPISTHPSTSRTNDGTPGTTVTFADQRRGSTTSSSCSGSSEASLVRLRHQQKKKELAEEAKPRPRPRTRVRRVENAEESTGDTRTSRIATNSAISRESYGGMTTEGLDDAEMMTPRLTRTPTSYLSMPSVKAFPRGAKIPEPLSRVLEPISIRYLDGDADNYQRRFHRSRVTEEDYEIEYESGDKGMTRHGSLEGDPGVIGPVVWKRHYFKANHTGRDPLDMSEVDGSISVGKMRKRFNDLIDDAFSMFGSRTESPEDKSPVDSAPVRSSDSRIHSAIIRPVETSYHFATRPKTTDSKRPMTAKNQGPRGAWDSPESCTTPLRPTATTSSSPIVVDKQSVLVDSSLQPSDPAVPLIKAIKDELQKFDHVSAKRTDPA